MPTHPTVFISYSWDDEAHKERVRNLATQLRADGVDARLDHWHTVSGDQLPQFIGREIRQNHYVIVVCTPKYKAKSDGRTGGVGYEGDMVTGEVLTTPLKISARRLRLLGSGLSKACDFGSQGCRFEPCRVQASLEADLQAK